MKSRGSHGGAPETGFKVWRHVIMIRSWGAGFRIKGLHSRVHVKNSRLRVWVCALEYRAMVEG